MSPLVPLRKIVPDNGARIVLKMQGENPTGSMKARVALAMIEAAEADGRLIAHGAMVEYTGAAPAYLICAMKGYPLYT